MKKQMLLFLWLLAGLTSFAQKAPLEKTLLWKVTGKGLKTSYLFGTTHQICKDEFIWTPAMDAALQASDKVCMEMDMDDPATMMTVAQGMISTDGKKLSDYFTTEEYSELRDYMNEKTKYKLEMFEMMKPIALLSLLIENAATCENVTSYEAEIAEKSKANNKEIVGIELPKEQLDALTSMNSDSIKVYVLKAVRGEESGTEEMVKIIELYKQQDIAGLQSFIENNATSSMGAIEALLPERNKRWIPRIVQKSKAHKVFYAVGAGHLGGKEGVINLLRKQGYKVEPVF